MKIHRKDCYNVEQLKAKDEERIIELSWSRSVNGVKFAAGIKVEGEDKPGMLKEITTAISGYKNTNIRSVNIDTKDGIFYGVIMVDVADLDHLNKLIDKIRRIEGIYSVERYQER